MINVLPQQEKKGVKREYNLRLATVCLCIITFLSVLAAVLLLPPYVLSSSKENAVEAQLSFMNSTAPTVSLADLNVFIEKINTTLSLFENQTKTRALYEDVLLPVLQSRPESITISQLLFSERGANDLSVLELHGKARDRASLQSFKTILERTGKFKSVDVPISNFVKPKNIDFIVTLYME